MAHRNIFYYDQASNVTCVRDTDLGLTYYTYDLADRVTSVKNPFDEVTYYEYNDCDRVSKRTLGNGCLTYFEYDIKDRVVKIDHRASNMTQLAELQYQYDKVGNPTKITREDGSATYYAYDKVKRLVAETQVDDQGQVEYAFEYQYSAAHNRTVKIENGTPTYYSYNAANQMVTETTGAETIYYQYDGCGNTVARQAPAGTTYYAYDTENLMTRIDFADGSHCYYTYDADSKRVSQRTPEGYTEFIYQGPDMLKLQMERDEAGETQVQYTMGAGLESMRRDAGSGMASGESSFFHYNHLGTTVALTNAAESVSDTYRHDAWGVQLANTGSTVNPHTYVGRERYYRMPTPDLYHLGFRDYGPRVGRFWTVDPVRSGRNWRAYVRNRATAMTDPRGLAASFLPPWFEHGLGHYHIEFPPGCYSGNCDKWRAGAEDRASAWEQRMAYWCVDVYQDMKKDCPGICSFLVKSLVDAAVYEGYDWLPGEIEKDINYRRCMTACDVGSLVTAGGCVAAVVVVYAAWTIGILGLYLGCVREHGHGDYTVIVRPPPDIEA